MLGNTDTPEDRMWSGGGINYIAEHEEVMSKLNRTYGLEKLIIKVDEKTFFRNNYSENYDKKTFVIEELESVPRLLKLNPGYNDLYMARSEDYKNYLCSLCLVINFNTKICLIFIKYVRIYTLK